MAIKFVAHKVTDGDGTVRWQSLSDHLLEVRELAYEFGEDLKIPHVTGLAGWLHDAGKYSHQFQEYIVDGKGKRGSVNHAFAGAQILANLIKDDTSHRYKSLAATSTMALVSDSIMAHHNAAGPYDFVKPSGDIAGTFSDKLNSASDVSEVQNIFFNEFSVAEFKDYVDLAIEELSEAGSYITNQYFYSRFISSCLVDADHTKTADFMSNTDSSALSSTLSLAELYQRNEESVERQKIKNSKSVSDATSKTNQLRDEMSQESFDAALEDDQLFSLSVPTGGGKTLASLRFGLRRCVSKSLNRIVYIIPFTTVIEQNAASVRDVLQLDANDYENVLEYHSTVTRESGREENVDARYIYARDTWDAPIIFTTQVAYLNALFGSGSKNLRHMHRLAKSVLIFDEIQSMPYSSVGMSNTAINWLTQSGRSTGVLCTATQPALDTRELDIRLNPSREIVHNLGEIEKGFKRVQVDNHADEVWDMQTLISKCHDELMKVKSLLVILNTKAAVRNAYLEFNDSNVEKFHLSTAMCPAHRQSKFTQIGEMLKETGPRSKKIIVFSTKLIEAGVDLSFASVFRSNVGMDSIVQSAGRCNRNHESPLGHICTFTMSSDVEKLDYLPDIKLGASITRELAKKYPDADPISSPIIREYFHKLFSRMNDKLDYQVSLSEAGDVALLTLVSPIGQDQVPNQKGAFKAKAKNNLDSSYSLTTAGQTVAKKYLPINQNTISVLVQWGKNERSKQLVTEIEAQKGNYNNVSDLLHEAQRYCVQVFADDKKTKAMLQQTVMDSVDGYGIYIARDGAYSDDFGLDLTGELDSKIELLNF